jgi:hypothetical protein
MLDNLWEVTNDHSAGDRAITGTMLKMCMLEKRILWEENGFNYDKPTNQID